MRAALTPSLNDPCGSPHLFSAPSMQLPAGLEAEIAAAAEANCRSRQPRLGAWQRGGDQADWLFAAAVYLLLASLMLAGIR